MGSPKEQLEANKEKSNEFKVSTSRKVVEVFMRILDYVLWIVIGIFVWVWWQTRGKPKVIGCSDISTALCNQCYGVAKVIGGGIANNSVEIIKNFSGLLT